MLLKLVGYFRAVVPLIRKHHNSDMEPVRCCNALVVTISSPNLLTLLRVTIHAHTPPTHLIDHGYYRRITLILFHAGPFYLMESKETYLWTSLTKKEREEDKPGRR